MWIGYPIKIEYWPYTTTTKHNNYIKKVEITKTIGPSTKATWIVEQLNVQNNIFKQFYDENITNMLQFHEVLKQYSQCFKRSFSTVGLNQLTRPPARKWPWLAISVHLTTKMSFKNRTRKCWPESLLQNFERNRKLKTSQSHADCAGADNQSRG